MEEIACTPAARALLDDASAAAMVTTLGLDNTRIAAIAFVMEFAMRWLERRLTPWKGKS